MVQDLASIVLICNSDRCVDCHVSSPVVDVIMQDFSKHVSWDTVSTLLHSSVGEAC